MNAEEFDALVRALRRPHEAQVSRRDLFAAAALHALLSDGYQPDIAAIMAAKAAEHLLADMDGH
jgi:saccharopine dehydrogenase-like NADP-dependent oxidoreductase